MLMIIFLKFFDILLIGSMDSGRGDNIDIIY